MTHVQLSASVRTRDGKDFGSLDKVIMDPRTGRITGVVAVKGLLLSRAVALPIEALEAAPDGSVRLAYSEDEVEDLPDFDHTSRVAPGPAGVTSSGPPPSGRVRSRRTRSNGCPAAAASVR